MNDFLDKQCAVEGCLITIPHEHGFDGSIEIEADEGGLCMSCLTEDCPGCGTEESTLPGEVLLESAGHAMVEALSENATWLEFVRTPCPGEVYRAPEFR